MSRYVSFFSPWSVHVLILPQTLVLHGYPGGLKQVHALNSCTSLTTLEVHPLSPWGFTPEAEDLFGEDMEHVLLAQVNTLKLHNSYFLPTNWDTVSFLSIFAFLAPLAYAPLSDIHSQVWLVLSCPQAKLPCPHQPLH